MKTKGQPSRRTGFTLMELLVVIAIIAILSVVGIGAYMSATVKSKDTKRKADLNQLSKAVEGFYNDVGRYPTASSGNPLCFTKNSSTVPPTVSDVDCTGKLYSDIDGNVINYINIPEDPESGRYYVYESPNGTSFAYYAALESKTDKDLLKSGGVVIEDPFHVSCGDEPCNYKITEAGLVKEPE